METTVQANKVKVNGKEVDHYDAFCLCDPVRGEGFLSEGWPTKRLAKARLDQHLEEHRTGEPAPPHAELMTPAEQVQAVDIATALAEAKKARGR